VQPDYQISLVIGSVLIAIICASIALYLVDGIEVLSRRNRSLRIVSSGVAFATGTWSMHFIGMLAFSLPVPMAYDARITILSYGIALAGAVPAMSIISLKEISKLQRLLAAFFLTLAICVMHYYGMSSMRMQPMIEYDPALFVLSILIAFVSSYVGLWVVETWKQEESKSFFLLGIVGILLGFAISAMHYTGMTAARFHSEAVSLAYLEQGLGDQYLAYAVISATLLVMLLLLFVILRYHSIVLWKVLLIVMVSETTVMLALPIFLPANASRWIEIMADVGLLALFVSPVAWRLKVTAAELLSNKKAVEQNLESQQVINQLLSLPLHVMDMESFLQQALSLVQEISWLKVLPKGAIFLNDAKERTLTMATQQNLSPEIRQSCAQVRHGHCLCGLAAESKELQYHQHVDEQHEIRYQGMKDHGHYNVPLLAEGDVYGVLCLYLEVGHKMKNIEMDTLKTIGATIAELIRLKQALEQIKLSEKVFEHNLTCLMVTDANNRILNVNPVFTEVTGFSAEEVIGQTPSMFKSGRHNKDFYRAMWDGLLRTNRWEGEIWNLRKNGEIFPEWLSMTVIRDQKNQVQNYVAAFADITVRKENEQRIKQLAYFDSLTGLANRTLFYDRLDQAILQAQRNNAKVALLFIDLDRFKEINDSLGHDAGDALLKNVARRITKCLRKTDTLARLGGDEFVVILRELQDDDSHESALVCQKVAENILARVAEAHEYKGHTFYGGASIGIILYPDNADNVSDLIQRADTAMYEAKNAGRNTYRFFSHAMADAINKRISLEHELRHALDKSELFLAYQPLIDMTDQAIIGAEVLLRWENAIYGSISPLEFIPLAEHTGLIHKIGLWVIEQACKQLLAWDKTQMAGLQYVAVNVSIYQIIREKFVAQAEAACQQNGIAQNRLELEITEGGLVQYPDNIVNILQRLRDAGFQLAIDDFGTDYSSLSRLKIFAVDLLKIDRSFVRDMTVDPDDAAIAKAIIEMAEALGLTTLAEGVETLEQFDLLKKMGCQRCQGYYFGKPMPAEQFEEYVTQQRSLG
jgi:diguanylate cyclase (GGDEF)-like protein/PAS domain S-box-containing protein